MKPWRIESLEILVKHLHENQYDLGGWPYIKHLQRVADSVKDRGVEHYLTALFHDSVEDKKTTLDELRSDAELPEQVIDAIDRLTKKPGQNLKSYASEIKGSEISRIVKLADIADNMDIRRLSEITQKDIDRLGKYVKLLRLLI